MKNRFLYLVILLFLCVVCYFVYTKLSMYAENFDRYNGNWQIDRYITSDKKQVYDHHTWHGECHNVNGFGLGTYSQRHDDNCYDPYDDNYYTIKNNCNNDDSEFYATLDATEPSLTTRSTIPCPAIVDARNERNKACLNAIKNNSARTDLATFDDNALLGKKLRDIKATIKNQTDQCKSYNNCKNSNSLFVGLQDISNCSALTKAINTRNTNCENASALIQIDSSDKSVLAYNDNDLLGKTYSAIYSAIDNKNTMCTSIVSCSNETITMNSFGIHKCLETSIQDTQSICNNTIDLANKLDANVGDHNDALFLQTLLDKTVNIDISNVSMSTARKILENTKQTCSKYYDKFQYWQGLEDAELSKPCRQEPKMLLPVDAEITSTLTDYSKTMNDYLDNIIVKLQSYIDELAPKGNFSDKLIIDVSAIEWSPPGTVPRILISKNFPQKVNITMPKGYTGDDGPKGKMGGIGPVGPMGPSGKSGATGTWSLPEQYYHMDSNHSNDMNSSPSTSISGVSSSKTLYM